jgi:hypothetical protein
MDFDSPYCSVTSSLTLWAFSYTHFMLTWNVKSLLCSLDLVACIKIVLSCILLLLRLFVHRLWSASVILCLLLVRLVLFAACEVHQLYYTCFLCGLICSPLCVTLLWLRPMLFCHGIHLQYRCDFQLVGFYPCFEMSCCGGPHFSCCGWWVGFTCDYWWLFFLL